MKNGGKVIENIGYIVDDGETRVYATRDLSGCQYRGFLEAVAYYAEPFLYLLCLYITRREPQGDADIQEQDYS